MSEHSSEPSQRILLVDDDIDLCRLIGAYLKRNGFSVVSCHNGDQAIDIASSERFDLIVLDLMLPGTDGLSVCRQIRQFFGGPIVMFTALEEEIDEVAGLEIGADDYVKKPVSPRLLLARIRALLRRRSDPERAATGQSISVGELEINPGRHEVRYRGQHVRLTTVEFDLLTVLANNAGEILSREQLYQALRHIEYDGLDRSIDLYISRIRKKIGDDSRDPRVIKTIRGAGYLCATE